MPNGLTVITDTKAAGGAAITISIDCGARDERASECGVANLSAQSALEGTASVSGRDATRLRAAYQIRGSAGVERTEFRAWVPAGSGCREAVGLLAGAISEATCYADVVEMEKRAAISELEMTEGTRERTRELLRWAVWREHGLGRPSAGAKASVMRLGRRHVLGFMDRQWRPERMTVAVVGPGDMASVEDEIAEAFGRMRPGADRTQTTPVWHPDAIYQRSAGPECHFAIGFPAVERGHRLAAGFDLLARVTAGGVESRLFRRLRTELNLVGRIRSEYRGYSDAGMWVIEGSTRRENETAAVRAVIEEMENFGNGCPVTEEELWKASRARGEAWRAESVDAVAWSRRLARDGGWRCGGENWSEAMAQASEVDALARRSVAYWLPEMGLARMGPELEREGLWQVRAAACGPRMSLQ
ncbi:MAG: insulinase family protein [Bryobacteraceae bacterium]